jgi:hypothetical protein
MAVRHRDHGVGGLLTVPKALSWPLNPSIGPGSGPTFPYG